MRSERKRQRFFKLRVYMDAIKNLKRLSNQDWIDTWAKQSQPNSVYIPRETYISYLEHCAMEEMQKLLKKAA